MSQTSEIDNLDRYKSYIQKRRVGFDNSEDDFAAESKSDRSPIKDIEDLSLSKENKTYEGFFGYGRETVDENKYTPSYRPFSHQTTNYPNRMDTSIYQKKRTNNYGASNHLAIEENRTANLAIKIIKQALACFAILGLIVFLQQRADAAGALTFIKSQVVDNHTEVSSLITGVENIITECSKIFGGLP